MDVQINLWGVLLAAVSSMVVGMVWYNIKLPIGAEWVKLTKNSKQVKEGDRTLSTSLIIAFIMSLVMAYVLAHVAYISFKFFGNSFLSASLGTALWLWLGVAFSRTLTHDAFEMRKFKLTAINTANMLATMVIMGLIIGLVGY